MITKIALFHPWIKSKGGAERVVLEILKKSKDKKYKIDVYTWVYDENNTFEEFKKFKINVIAQKFAQKFSRHYILRGLFFPIGLFSKIPVKNYDIFLISTSGLAELIALRNYKKGKTFAYIHTPLRAANKDELKWNLKYRYKNIVSKIMYLIAVKFYIFLERIAWKKIDVAIFNSELSLERAKEHNLIKNKKTYVIYPPIKNLEKRHIKAKKENYFLYVSRFNPMKRQDILINAWDKFVKENLDYKLILAGGIEDKKYFNHLCKMAKKTKNVEIKINLNDKDIKRLYSNCLAVIFIPFMEDFGIVPFEALSMKKPLIVTNKGGYMRIIKDLPQVIQIEEKVGREEMVNETYKCLKQFLGLKVKFKKVNFNHLNEENFRRELFDVLEGKNEKMYGKINPIRKINWYLMKKFNFGLKRNYPFRTSTIFAKEYFKGKDDLIAIEIGTLRGESAGYLLNKIPFIKKLYCIDPYDKIFVTGGEFALKHFNAAKKRLKKFSHKCEFIKETSDDALKNLKEKGIKADFVYIDGLHTYEQVKRDIENYFPLVKEGGIISGHDIQEEEVTKAILEFCCKNRITPLIKEMDWIIVKKSKNPYREKDAGKKIEGVLR